MCHCTDFRMQIDINSCVFLVIGLVIELTSCQNGQMDHWYNFCLCMVQL